MSTIRRGRQRTLLESQSLSHNIADQKRSCENLIVHLLGRDGIGPVREGVRRNGKTSAVVIGTKLVIKCVGGGFQSQHCQAPKYAAESKPIVIGNCPDVSDSFVEIIGLNNLPVRRHFESKKRQDSFE